MRTIAFEICARSDPPRGRPSSGVPSGAGLWVTFDGSSSAKVASPVADLGQRGDGPVGLYRVSQPLTGDAIAEERDGMSLTETQRTTLRLFCDTIVPRIEREPDPHGFFARAASDIGVEQGVEQLIGELDEELQTGLARLLDALASQIVASRPTRSSRAQVIKNMSLASPEAAGGLQALA